MDPWSILEIECTNDIGRIKRAYVSKVKLFPPEEDSEGFQNVRQAYESALAYAKHALTENINTTSNEMLDNATGIGNPLSIPEFIQPHDTHTVNMSESLQAFMARVKELYTDYPRRIQLNNWEVLLGEDIFWAVDHSEAIGSFMLAFFENHHFLPQEIWKLLNSHFYWTHDHIEKHHSQPDKESFFLYIKRQMEQTNPIHYECIRPSQPIDYDLYLQILENAQIAFQNYDLTSTASHISQAKKIYAEGPDLLLLESLVAFNKNRLESAIELLDKYLSILPNNQNAILYRATAYYEKNEIAIALKEFNTLFSRMLDEKDLALLMARNYMKMSHLKKAKEWTEKALKIKATRKEAKKLLIEIQAKIRIRLTKELQKDPDSPVLKSQLKAINEEIKKSQLSTSYIFKQKGVKIFKKVISILLFILILLICIGFRFIIRIL